jgi:hypothetical protein
MESTTEMANDKLLFETDIDGCDCSFIPVGRNVVEVCQHFAVFGKLSSLCVIVAIDIIPSIHEQGSQIW